MEKSSENLEKTYKTTKRKKEKKDKSHLPMWQLKAREDKKRKRSKKLIYFDEISEETL